MKCADCKLWTRYEQPYWAPQQPERWASIVARGELEWGECGRPYNEGFKTRLMRVELDYELDTHETFGCVQFEERA